MTHLSAADLMDLVEGVASREVLAHAAACDLCHRRAADAAEGLALGGRNEVPEPSPLFWEHLSRRIQTAVRDEPRPARSRWPLAWSWRPGRFAVAVAVVAVAAVAVWRGRAPVPALDHAPGAAVSQAEALVPELAVDDESWSVVAGLVSEMSADVLSAEGMAAPAGAIDHAVGAMTEEQRAELARLLKAEIGTP